MPASPAQAERLAAGVVAHYQDAEAQLIARMAKNLARGIDAPEWVFTKLAQMQEYERQARRLLADLEKKAAIGISTAITDAYDSGGMSAVADIAKLKPGVPPVEPLAGLRAVEALTRETLGNVVATHPGILRSVMDGYRSVIAESQTGILLGNQTRRQAAQTALNRFAAKGISGFVDKAGRGWTMESYTEMALRTGAGRAQVQGHVDRLAANGLNLVIVSDAPKECPLCRPWEGKVLSIGAVPVEMPEEMDPAFQVAPEVPTDASVPAGYTSIDEALDGMGGRYGIPERFVDGKARDLQPERTLTALNQMDELLGDAQRRGLPMPHDITVGHESGDPLAAAFRAWDPPTPGGAPVFELHLNVAHNSWDDMAKSLAHDGPDHLRLYSSAGKQHMLEHEYAHLLQHDGFGRAMFVNGMWPKPTTIQSAIRSSTGMKATNLARWDEITNRVSRYAMESPGEFVSEVYAGVRDGIGYDDEVMALYRQCITIKNVPVDALHSVKPRP